MEIGSETDLANTADNPSAPSPNRSTSSLFSWQRVALHCGLKQNDLATAVTWNCLIATVQLLMISLSIDGLTGLQQVLVNLPSSVLENVHKFTWENPKINRVLFQMFKPICPRAPSKENITES
ncbi:hypothetical protein KIN20_001192 [Parelaphostrongylus tenuis]|uniref:Uncharacterized protein n=1 Tax=Parelaphostrongylus tenuis TaxID=148309 RepID=A0AAD5MEF5_PARTN|nr:hypothetical protein KIN20_001192 [Parelaphostrongylus tenuis]